MVLLKKTGTHKRLGEMLVETGIITSEQLQEALEEQKKSGGRLGQNLMALGYITEDVMAAFVGKQLGISYVSLSEYGEISGDVTKIVPENICRHQTLVPISMEDNILTIAMADPLNVFTVDDLRVMTGYEIKVVISSEAEIKQAIEKYYGNKGSMEDILKTMDDGKGGATLEVVTQEEEQVDIASLEAAGEEAPVVKIVNLILTGAVKSGASDIHIEPFEKSLRTRYRIDGVLHEISSPPKRMTSAIVSRIKIMANLDIAERRLPQDGRIKVKVIGKEIDLRVSILPTAFGEKVVMRILDASSLCLDLTKLGFEPDVLPIYQKHIEIPYGIVLVTGPTGSGKSTTLYSSLSTLNYPDRNIMTIEDPVEYVLEGINQVQAKPDIGLTFAAGLRSFLRQDPDIIMVGEIRDAETAEIAINAALTGHLVFSTLHTNDASGAVTRLTNMGIEPFLTASTVVMVIAQRLVRVICENCKEDYQVPAQFIRDLGQKYEDDKPVLLYRGKGCDRCTNTGYRGRLACYEIMVIDDEIRDLVLERASTHLVKQKSREHGMVTLREAAFRKVISGTTTVEEMMRVTFADAA
ncbi:MAG: type IV-A pilus assembly ATPase PilB [bacterium]|nr:type IV-A pilus assembly ATPase PilB [bacterium]MDD5354594.1 type IV-A pilus assembly ATPase PilB [bacterium]MDD5755987.1 type IV-A pilus assembly ATPase PilB [bacterium]